MLRIFKDPGYIKRYRTLDFFLTVESVAEEIQHRMTEKLSLLATRKQAEPLCLRRILCPECEVFRSDRSRHCPICNRCVDRFNHHCPWINNCVGNNNHLLFICYLLSSIIHLGSIVILMILIIRGAFVINTNKLTNAE
jgi:hypothetical protein